MIFKLVNIPEPLLFGVENGVSQKDGSLSRRVIKESLPILYGSLVLCCVLQYSTVSSKLQADYVLEGATLLRGKCRV